MRVQHQNKGSAADRVNICTDMKIHSLGRTMGKCADLLVPIMWTVLISQVCLHNLLILYLIPNGP